MKLGPYLLINLLMVGGGIFIYDSLKGDNAGTSAPAPDYGNLMTADAPGSPEPADTAPIELDGGAREMLMRENAKRLNVMERIIGDLRRQLERSKVGSSGGTDASGGGVMPSLSQGDIVDERNPSFDDDTLTTIAAYIDEINRRKNEERQKVRITTELERKGIKLSETQRDSVVGETLAYQAKARELLRKQFSRDQAGREERKQAFEGLQQEYASVINSLVPEEEAEKILDSRLGRGMGFFGNFASGGNPGRLRRGPGGQGK